MQLLGNVEAASSKTEIEIQLSLSELNQVISSLGEAAVALIEDWNILSPFYLRHSSHGVRHGAATIIASLSVLAPIIAVEFLTHARSHAKAQAKQVTSTQPLVGYLLIDKSLVDTLFINYSFIDDSFIQHEWAIYR